MALHQQGDLAKARAGYEDILAQVPEHGDALHLLAQIFASEGDWAEAEALARRALRSVPEQAPYQVTLGNILLAKGDLAGAKSSYASAAKADPSLVVAWFNLGLVAQSGADFDEALAAYDRAVKLSPDYAEAHNNRGNVLLSLGRTAEARTAYQNAATARAHYPEAWFNLGRLDQSEQRLKEAEVSYRTALADLSASGGAHPEMAAMCHCHLGLIARDRGALPEALSSFVDAFQLAPDDAAILLPLAHTMQHLCEWPQLDTIEAAILQATDERPGRGSPFALTCLRTTPERQRRFIEAWTEQFPQDPNPVYTAGDVLRVGYVGDFQAHATTMMVAELLEHHGRSDVTYTAFALAGDDGSAIRKRVGASGVEFVDISQSSSAEAVAQIRQAGIGVLVDLKGYTQGGRPELFSRRSAPVQINWFGFPGTMGGRFMDYVISDAYLTPPGRESDFGETVLRMPHCYQVNDGKRPCPAAARPRAEYGLPEDAVVLAAFCPSYKIQTEMFGAWLHILREVPGAVLWLLESNPWATERLKGYAESQNLADRIVFAPRVDYAAHLARHRAADLFLDSFPVSGHTTVSDALWMECPVVTRVGTSFISRVAGSLLTTLGLPELITTDVEAYVNKVIELAQNEGARQALSDRLRAQRDASPLWDAEAFARDIEALYQAAWATWRRATP